MEKYIHIPASPVRITLCSVMLSLACKIPPPIRNWLIISKLLNLLIFLRVIPPIPSGILQRLPYFLPVEALIFPQKYSIYGKFFPVGILSACSDKKTTIYHAAKAAKVKSTGSMQSRKYKDVFN